MQVKSLSLQASDDSYGTCENTEACQGIGHRKLMKTEDSGMSWTAWTPTKPHHWSIPLVYHGIPASYPPVSTCIHLHLATGPDVAICILLASPESVCVPWCFSLLSLKNRAENIQYHTVFQMYFTIFHLSEITNRGVLAL